MLAQTYMATHLASRVTYIARPKPTRKGLRWSVMPAQGAVTDELVNDEKRVPASMRLYAGKILLDERLETDEEKKNNTVAHILRAIGLGLISSIAVLVWQPAQAQTPLPVPRPIGPGGSCPYGYVTSGSFCVPMQGAQDAIPKPPNGTCPFGWTSSGNFCLRSGSGR